MKKDEMIQINSALITNENKRLYLEYYETIWETIKETYCCLFYLEGIGQHFGENYKCTGKPYEFFIKDIIKLLKQKICLNVNKLIFDKGKNVLTIYKMQNYIREHFNVIITEPHIKVEATLEDLITNMRHTFISHNLHTDNDCSVDMRDLKPLLDKIYNFFQKLWIKNFITDGLFISDGYFDFYKSFYINAVQEAFMAVKP